MTSACRLGHHELVLHETARAERAVPAVDRVQPVEERGQAR